MYQRKSIETFTFLGCLHIWGKRQFYKAEEAALEVQKKVCVCTGGGHERNVQGTIIDETQSTLPGASPYGGHNPLTAISHLSEILF